MKSHIAAALTALVLTSGCTTVYEDPQFKSAPGADTRFTGISSQLGARPLDVLLVHGMCTHDAVWAKESVQQLYAALGGDPKTVNLVERQVAGTNVLIYQQTLSTSGGVVRANALVWSRLTIPLKKQLCYDMTDRAPYCTAEDAPEPYAYKRASLNRELKDNILNDCLADAMTYQGVARIEINRQMQLAVLDALATSGASRSPAPSADMALIAEQENNAQPLVVITDSLGSKVTFDALYRLTRGDSEFKDAGQKTIDRLTSVFMKANQMPILSLADQNVEGAAPNRVTAEFPTDSLGAIIRSRSARVPGAVGTAPSVVAFTDPNDVLSYVLAPSAHRRMNNYAVVDVVSSNAKTYVGFFELPTTAHLNYGDNKNVYRLMVCGNPSSCSK
jgi:hypothetical protein